MDYVGTSIGAIRIESRLGQGFLSADGWIGQILLEQGRPAEQPLGKACRLLEPLVAKDSAVADWRLQLGVCRSRTAAALERLDLDQARSEARVAIKILAPLLKVSRTSRPGA